MIIFIFGEEKYLVRERLNVLREAFSKKNPEAHIDELDFDEEFDADRLRETILSGQGLFSKKKMVVLKNAFTTSSSMQENITETLKNNVAEGKELIIVIAELGENKTKGKLLQLLKKKAKCEEYKKLKSKQVQNWVIKETAKRSDKKVSINSSALKELVMISKNSLWKLSSEIDKLVSFKEQGIISLEDARAICRGENEVKIFDLVDAIGQDNKTRSVQLKSQLIRQGENDFYIFTMIMFQIRNLLRVSQCKRKGSVQCQAIAGKLKMHPFVVQKTLRQLDNFSKTKLKQIYQLASDIDLQTKKGNYKMEEALDYFMMKI